MKTKPNTVLGKLKKAIDPCTLTDQLNKVFSGDIAGKTLAERMYNLIYAGELAGLVDSRVAMQIYDMCAEEHGQLDGRKPYVPGPIVEKPEPWVYPATK